MGRFNLIDSPWIKVIVDAKGRTELVSLLDLIENAADYKQFGGDMKIQDFAVMRFVLAILHTVYSRFNSDDEIYEYLELDDKLRPINNVDDYEEEYNDDLMDTWLDLWESKQFSSIVKGYLMTWYDYFYLYDDEFPLFQITDEDLEKFELNKKSPSVLQGKILDRTISESGNKVALLSSKVDAEKNIMTHDEIARWLLLFQGCIGTFDKVIFGTEKYKASKGWLYDLGGIAFNGENIFKTLMLNLVLVHPREEYRTKHQTPSWEYSGAENVKQRMNHHPIENLAQLYTIWGRAIQIDSSHEEDQDFKFSIVKLPDINHQNQFLEPMTVWRHNKSGENKDTFTPKKHMIDQSLWRSFGLIFPDDENSDEYKRPILLDYLYEYTEQNLDGETIGVESFSMIDDGNATSWMPSDEYYDQVRLHDYILFDSQGETSWINRINDEVGMTNQAINRILRTYFNQILEIRNMKNTPLVNKWISETYYDIDYLFRNWLNSIQKGDAKNIKVQEWRQELYREMIYQANQTLKSASHRDFKGIESDKKMINIATAYNTFVYWLKQTLKV